MGEGLCAILPTSEKRALEGRGLDHDAKLVVNLESRRLYTRHLMPDGDPNELVWARAEHLNGAP